MPAELHYEIDGQPVAVPLAKDDVTIGREGTNDVVIERQSISRRHARLYRVGSGWRIMDLGSLNGTRVNGIDQIDAPLLDGDRILLHTFPLVFRDAADTRASLTAHLDDVVDPSTRTVVQAAVDFSALAASPPDVRRLQKLLAIVTEASATILASNSLDETCGKVLDLIFQHLPVQRGLVMLRNESDQELFARCVRERTGAEPAAQIRFSRTIAERVCREKVAVLTTDAQADERFIEGASVFELGIRSAIAAPLWNADRVTGLIYVDTLQVNAFDRFDLDLLSALGNHVAVAIEQSRLQQSVLEQQWMRRRLERYHSPAVIDLITSGRESAGEVLMASERDVTVLFANVVDFTSRCERMGPRAVAELLNRYFSEMVERVFRHQGTLDKFIGDCLMAVFGAPLASDDHARRAAEAVLEMRDALAELNDPLPADSRVQFRVGIHSGRVVAGDIGSIRRSDYTVLGATVNLAARLESSVARPGQIVISAATNELLLDGYDTRAIGEHQLKGLSSPVCCYELVGRRPTIQV